MNRVIWTRELRKAHIVDAVRSGAGQYTVREIGELVGLKPSRYLRQLVAELVDEGWLAYWEYDLPNGLPLRVYVDASIFGDSHHGLPRAARVD